MVFEGGDVQFVNTEREQNRINQENSLLQYPDACLRRFFATLPAGPATAFLESYAFVSPDASERGMDLCSWYWQEK